jgi:opacity protein-like surface antigen
MPDIPAKENDMARLSIVPVLLLGASLALPAAARAEFYLGGTVGNVSINTDFEDINRDFDDDNAAWSAFAGIRATDTFGIEASYNDFGDFSESREFDLTRIDVDADFTGYDVMGVLTLPLGPLRLFGKAGVVFWDAEAVAQIAPPVGPAFEQRSSDDGTDLAYGGGLEFTLTPAFALRGEIEYFDIDDTDQVWFASVGLSYRF